MSDAASTPYVGGCFCGAVRYRAAGAPIVQGNCHCRDCQKTSGGPYAPTLFFPIDAVAITGEVKYHESIGGSGQRIQRGFCPECGSQLFGRPSGRGTMMGIRAGTLDDPAVFRPTAEIFVSQAAPWDRMLDATVKFESSVPA